MIDSVSGANNQPAFKATLRIETAVKDSARLKGIAKAFSAKTADMKDILSISSNIAEYDNKECFYLGKKYENSAAAFFEDSFDTMMEKLNDNDLVTKLVKIAKSIRAVNKRDAYYERNHSERFRLQAEQRRNQRIAQGCREKGDDVMASRFDVLAGIFGKRLAKMDAEQQKVDANTLKTIEKVADGDAEILAMKSLIF